MATKRNPAPINRFGDLISDDEEVGQILKRSKRNYFVFSYWQLGVDTTFYAAKKIIAQRNVGRKRFLQVEWEDGSPATWEPESNINGPLLAEWDATFSAKVPETSLSRLVTT